MELLNILVLTYISAENHGRLKAHKRQHYYAGLSSLVLFVSTT